MSFLIRFFRRFRSPTGFVGRDLEGNRFYEHPSVSDDPRRTKRVVKYARGTEMLDYVSGDRRLAVQWTSWLTHTRAHPPTLDELRADLERRRRILMNVAMIEAREREQAAQLAQQDAEVPRVQASFWPSRQTNSPAKDSDSLLSTVAQDTPQTHASSQPLQHNDTQSSPTSPWKPPPRDEPHSWQPRASIRRGG